MREHTFSLCESCGLDRVVAIAALAEPDDPDGLESENKALVKALIGNCESCRQFEPWKHHLACLDAYNFQRDDPNDELAEQAEADFAAEGFEAGITR